MTSETGFCVWLTGLSGAGKSTIAAALEQALRGWGRGIVVFDGDAVRTGMSSDLGFSRRDRNENVVRVAAKAAEVARSSGIAICALMSPYSEGRQRARSLIGSDRFVLIHVATPLPVCEARDTKGLYAKARRGEVQHVVGIDDDYETPQDADLLLDTSTSSVEADVQRILDMLVRGELIPAARPGPVSHGRA